MIPLSKRVASFGIFDEALLKFIVFSSSPWINNAELKEKFCNDFEELKIFLLEDSVYSISTIGQVPDVKIIPEHQKRKVYKIAGG